MRQLLRAITSDGYDVCLLGRLLAMVWNRVNRIGCRFTAAATATPHPPRPSGSRSPNLPSAAAQMAQNFAVHNYSRPLVLPSGHGWLHIIIPRPGIAAAAARLQTLLAEPEFARLLDQTPSLARILRPLCHLLGIALPPPHHRPPPKFATPPTPPPSTLWMPDCADFHDCAEA